MRRAIRCVRLRRGLLATLCPCPPLRLPRTASLPRSRTAVSSRSTPTAAACARSRFRRSGRDHGARVVAGRQPARVRAGGRIASIELADPARREPDDRCARHEHRLVVRRRADRLPPRGALLMSPMLAADGTPRDARADAADGAAQLGWAPDLKRCSPSSSRACWCSGRRSRRSPVVAGAPAWSPDGTAIAFANGEGLSTIKQRAAPRSLGGARPRSRAPRWSPDSRSLLYAAETELRTVAATRGAPRSC